AFGVFPKVGNSFSGLHDLRNRYAIVTGVVNEFFAMAFAKIARKAAMRPARTPRQRSFAGREERRHAWESVVRSPMHRGRSRFWHCSCREAEGDPRHK